MLNEYARNVEVITIQETVSFPTWMNDKKVGELLSLWRATGSISAIVEVRFTRRG